MRGGSGLARPAIRALGASDADSAAAAAGGPARGGGALRVSTDTPAKQAGAESPGSGAVSPTSAALRLAAQKVLAAEEEEYANERYESDDGEAGKKPVKSELLRAVKTVDAEESGFLRPGGIAATTRSLSEAVRELDREDAGKPSRPESDEPAEDERTMPDLAAQKRLLRQAFHGDWRGAKELLAEQERELGEAPNVNCADRHGWTPLMWCASRGHVRMAELLLERGALLNKEEETNGWTALHLAAIAGRAEVVTLLLERGARRAQQDRWGDIAHECAPRPVKGPTGDSARALRRELRPDLTKSKPKGSPLGSPGDASVRSERSVNYYD